MKKLNCWEVKKCGQDVANKGSAVCPVRDETRLDGVHGGFRAGRACWVVAGTLCGGKVQGDFAAKYNDCEQCDFYKQVKKEEGADHVLSIILLKRLNQQAAAK